MSTEREAAIRELAAGGKLDEAIAASLRLYGREVLSFLVALHRDEGAAGDVFSDFAEELWKSLPGFRWQCSLRTYCYTLARRAAWRHRNDPRRRPERNVPLSQARVASQVAAEVKSETAAYLRDAAKDKLQQIRATLGPEDQALLSLRVDKEMAWNDIARVLLEDEGGADDLVKREAARLRKRFELLKKRLLELGRQHGLVQGTDG